MKKEWLLAWVGLASGFQGCSSMSGDLRQLPGLARPGMSGAGESVLEHHRNPSRAGAYADSTFSLPALASLRRLQSFGAFYRGAVFAQPLYLSDGPDGVSTIYVATEQNEVLAFRASDGGLLWRNRLGMPAPRSALGCGNIDPLGVTGTPIIDADRRTLYLDAMIVSEEGADPRHQLFALSVDDGSVKEGWPLDVGSLLAAQGIEFDPAAHNQRGALALLGGLLYVPYGGHFGDCGTYRGAVLGVNLADPTRVHAWRPARGGGIWAPGGVVSDGASLYVTTGNTFGASAWAGGQAVVRLFGGPVFSGSSFDFFAPENWRALDDHDLDISGAHPSLIDLPGAVPRSYLLALGKDGMGYLLERKNLGGIGGAIYQARVDNGEIISAPAVYTTAQGTYVVFKASDPICPEEQSGDLVALRVAVSEAGVPSFKTAWCAWQGGLGSPIVNQPDGTGTSAVVLGVGAEGDGKLRGFDGDTGFVVFAGGRASDSAGNVRRYSTPIIAEGRIYIAADNGLAAYGVSE